MTYKISVDGDHEAFMRAWRDLFERFDGAAIENYDDLFFSTYNVKLIRTPNQRGTFRDLDHLELEFEDEGKYLLFMLEWA